MASLSRWQKLKANKMLSAEFCTERTAWGAGVGSVSFTLFMIGFRFSRETKNPATFSGAGLKKTGFKLFSFALPAGPPYQGRVQILNNGCGYEAIQKNSNRGTTRGKSAVLQHHSVAHQHCAWKIHRNKYMSNE